ncbi:hypothetical protein GCM10027048_23310 [Hymenobacter coalescens]
MEEITLYKSRWQAIRIMLLCSVFVLGGIWLLLQTDAPRWVGWASVLFFGLGYPLGIYNLLDRRPLLIVNNIGLYHREAHRELINWELIQDAYLAEVHKQQLLCLVVPPDFEPSTRKGKLAQQLGGVSRAMGFQELTLPLSATGVDAPKFLELVLLLKDAAPTTRQNLLRAFVG